MCIKQGHVFKFCIAKSYNLVLTEQTMALVLPVKDFQWVSVNLYFAIMVTDFHGVIHQVHCQDINSEVYI